ncbi:MAG TPA: hypothetical protein VHB21_14820 [Minicystis sp.]|nr:hypothetical protein [Minicystis sp.]
MSDGGGAPDAAAAERRRDRVLMISFVVLAVTAIALARLAGG